mgnify:CR=1 FL=1
MGRINNGRDGTGLECYLHCSVDDQVSNYIDDYSSSEECLDDIRDSIVEDCKGRGYSESETESVVSHYEIKFSNYDGEWNGK